ncbi:AAA family ATPase [Microbacter margulisiae]|uniref:Cytidylate kinase n=1 Tax=Microbacter margulisiae TaxID=1350067 RepID=A0A7W5H2N1_9PORP|nr:cytidylate kinase-like family protein [Microbacter margulisiae]MBB3187940.1 cytidylate kinase [Microbacter margulisiae]
MKPNQPLIITISRQIGSGGAYIGQQIARYFDILYADREIISETAQRFSIHPKEIAHRDEKIISAWEAFMQAITRNPDRIEFSPFPPTDKELFKAESEVIERLATERSAVIMGRCGSYILRQHPNHISIFLHASNVFRIKHLCEVHNMSEIRAQKTIAEYDKDRGAYIHQFTGLNWTDATQYNLTFRTDILGLETSAKEIINFIETTLAKKEL